MKKEKSCGAVVYKIQDGQLYILILRMKRGHISIPKGHVENQESEEETALREIKEETNLTVVIDTHFREVITYFPFAGVCKDVVFFVAKYIRGEIKEQESEVEKAMWLNANDALNILTHKSDQEVVKKAIYYITKEHKNENISN